MKETGLSFLMKIIFFYNLIKDLLKKWVFTIAIRLPKAYKHEPFDFPRAKPLFFR